MWIGWPAWRRWRPSAANAPWRWPPAKPGLPRCLKRPGWCRGVFISLITIHWLYTQTYTKYYCEWGVNMYFVFTHDITSWRNQTVQAKPIGELLEFQSFFWNEPAFLERVRNPTCEINAKAPLPDNFFTGT